MATATAERFTTGNVILDMRLPLLTEQELDKLADYADHLMRLREEDDDDSWADAPLTPEEEAQIEESIRDYENGEYLTLDELMERL